MCISLYILFIPLQLVLYIFHKPEVSYDFFPPTLTAEVNTSSSNQQENKNGAETLRDPSRNQVVQEGFGIWMEINRIEFKFKLKTRTIKKQDMQKKKDLTDYLLDRRN